MLKPALAIFFFLFLACTTSYGQSTDPPKEENSFAPAQDQPSAIQRKTMKKKGKKSRRSLFNKRMDKKIKEFDKRMAANARQNRKEARLALQPKYSDPSYFGHKRKPKKRPPGKRKFCKECSLTH